MLGVEGICRSERIIIFPVSQPNNKIGFSGVKCKMVIQVRPTPWLMVAMQVPLVAFHALMSPSSEADMMYSSLFCCSFSNAVTAFLWP